MFLNAIVSLHYSLVKRIFLGWKQFLNIFHNLLVINYLTFYIIEYLSPHQGEFSEKVINKTISEVLKVGMRTIDRVKKKFVEEGFNNVLERHTGIRVYQKKADGDFEAHLTALACSKAPDGYARWSLRMLADKMVENNYIEDISHETIRKVLKKTNLNRGK
jgi:hypothetical protein